MEYSASNFERFREAQLAMCDKRLNGDKEQSLENAEKMLQEADIRGKVLLEECVASLEKERTARHKEHAIRTGLEAHREQCVMLDNQTLEITQAVRTRIEDAFCELAGCFVSWLDAGHDGGSIRVFAELAIAVPEKFTVQIHQQRSICFSKENLFIEFSVETLMEEYAAQIRRQIYERTGA